MAFMEKNTSEYRAIHAAFMQNHNGTSPEDVFITVLPNIFTSCIAKYIILYLGISNCFLKICLEYTIIVIPIILSTTIFAEHRSSWCVISIILFCTVYFKNFNVRTVLNTKIDRRKKWQCISDVRSLTLLLTSYAILAVDFNIFPRYLAKTEKFGYSLMDAGVGLFIFCNALVPSKVSRHSLIKSLELNVKQCFALITLGLGRAILLTKGVEYQQHVTEYGVHWNFFLTLAVAKICCTVIMCIFKEDNSLMSGILLLCVHEISLYRGLSSWVFSNIARDNFFAANREGLVSCSGYVALYLISAYVGRTVRERYNDKSEGDVFVSLLYIIFISWTGVYLTNTYLSVSRCLINMGYCCFIIAIGTSCLILLFLFEVSEASNLVKVNKIKKHQTVSSFLIIYSAINNNGLLFFLLSNIITGLINLSFQTLYLSTSVSLFIIFSYMFFIIITAVLFHRKFEKLKS